MDHRPPSAAGLIILPQATMLEELVVLSSATIMIVETYGSLNLGVFAPMATASTFALAV